MQRRETTFNILTLAIFFLMLLFCFFSPGIILAAEEKTVLNIIYTGEGHGEIEPCGCSEKASYGGLKRRGTFLLNYEMKSETIIIEAGNFIGELTEQGEIKAELIVDAMSILGYDVIATGEAEEKFGLGKLADFSKKRNIDMLSRHDIKFPSSIKKVINGTTVHVHLNPNLLFNLNEGFHILIINKADVDIVSLINQKTGFDLIIYTGSEYQKAERINDTIVARVNDDGESVGVLTITLDHKGELTGFNERQVLLDKNFEDDPGMTPLFKKYNNDVVALFEKLNRDKENKRGIFFGDKECKICHEPHWEQWNTTQHVTAWEALEKTGKASDPECIGCHSVGYGKEGGFISRNVTPELIGVQCENCHGAGRDHLENPSKRLRPISEAICLECHNEKHSSEFEFSTYLPDVKH